MNPKKALPSEQRLKLLIEPKFQIVMLIYINGLLLLTLALYFYSVLHLFSQLDTQLGIFGLSSSHPYLLLIQQQKRSLLAFSVVSGGFILFLGNVGILILSHRIIGPIFRTKQLLRGLIAGEIKGKVKFRDTDFFKDLENEWNDYLETSQKR